jgi:ABC-type uncharacterized transport system permease subunit
VFWLRAALLLYGAGFAQVLISILRREERVLSWALGPFAVGCVLHFVSLTESGFYHGALPVTNFHETSSICAFLNALLLLFISWRNQFRGLALVLIPLVFFLTLIGATELPVAPWTDRKVRGLLLTTHIVLVLVGYAALLLTAASSFFYLIQERNLKLKRRSGLFERLPSLSTLDDMISRSMNWGFVFTTLSIVIASIWGFIETGTRWILHGEVLIAFLTWGLYLWMIVLRTSAGWRGRKAALLALTVLGCSALTWITHIGLRFAP